MAAVSHLPFITRMQHMHPHVRTVQSQHTPAWGGLWEAAMFIHRKYMKHGARLHQSAPGAAEPLSVGEINVLCHGGFRFVFRGRSSQHCCFGSEDLPGPTLQ